MKVHFISIGGSVMHNLAIALHKKGFIVTGSDDEIFEPSKSHLAKYNLLPDKMGWDTDNITPDLDAVILGMHARIDNCELQKAQKSGLKIFSYPEYIYEQCKNKTRVVIGGSHGKTTITSMVMHVLREHNINFDYIVGAKIEGFETMVKLTNDAYISIFEGDEYLSSPIDRRPKFHVYKPHIALLSGIAWDHINVFPSFENYVEQFKIFIDLIQKNGSLVYFEDDKILKDIVDKTSNNIKKIAYSTHNHIIKDNTTFLITKNKNIPLYIFGEHNLQNINGAKLICNKIGLSNNQFYDAIATFKGAKKRLELLDKNEHTNVFVDFAHSPSKLKATTQAVKEQFPNRMLVACIELHTYSSLNKNFLKQYKGTMKDADIAYVYFNPHTVKQKKLKLITKKQIMQAFEHSNITVFTDSQKLIAQLLSIKWKNKNLLLMSSGNFSGIDFKKFAKEILYCKNN